jgi:hypothetical protein
MHQNSKESVQLGERIHRLLRLCAVAIMKRKIEYVDAVLREIDTWRYGSTKKPWRPEYAAQAMLASDVHECSIAASLKQMMENLSTIAAASITTIPLSV